MLIIDIKFAITFLLCSETVESGNFGEGSNPIGGKDIWREMSEQRFKATGGPDLVEVLEAVEGAQEKREYRQESSSLRFAR